MYEMALFVPTFIKHATAVPGTPGLSGFKINRSKAH